jgi:heptaprenyl diphosphate synthase
MASTSHRAPHDVLEVDRALGRRVRSRMSEVELQLHATVASPEEPRLAIAAAHLLAAGGKRIRPLLALLAGEFGDPAAPGVRTAAVIVELAHVASLYHDDVMDEALTRRGVVSANARWGNSVAVLTGDFLLAKTAELSAEMSTEVVRTQSAALSRLVRGQLLETMGPQPGADLHAHYLSVIRDKTGTLLSLATRLGALGAGAAPGLVRALDAYAEALGVAFQIADDILDLTEPAEESGKSAGIDLVHGLTTLPVLYALEEDRIGAELRELLGGGPVHDEARLARTLTLLGGSDAIARSHAEVERHCAVALDALSVLPAIPARAALADLCAVVAERSAAYALTPAA